GHTRSRRRCMRALADTEAFRQSRRERKKVEMRFAHKKRFLKLDRLRLGGLSGAKEEVLLTEPRRACGGWSSSSAARRHWRQSPVQRSPCPKSGAHSAVRCSRRRARQTDQTQKPCQKTRADPSTPPESCHRE